MTRYAVVGASSGTGLALVKRLAELQIPVRAISRQPPEARAFIEPFAADVTDVRSISKALDGEFNAVCFTVDIQGLLNSRESIRGVMYHGCVNAMQACKEAEAPPKFVLLSVIGPALPSWVWAILNAGKPGMRQNVLDREQALKDSGLRYVICRAPKLSAKTGGGRPITATPPQHQLDMKMSIPREDLARALVCAAENAPERTTWDVFTGDEPPVPSWLGG